MTILVPTDFSENANHALEYGLEIASLTDGQLNLYHVMPNESPLPARLEAEENLQLICNTISGEYPDIDCQSIVHTGNVVDAILQQAERVSADMIVMGTKGASNLARLFFGSNTAAVIERSTCTVLSVPGSLPFKAPQKALFATNFSPEDLKAALQFVNFAKAFQATVIIAHVSLEQEREDVEASMVQIFANQVAELTGYAKITARLSSENTISLGLDALITETQADVIALSTRKRGLFEKIYNPSITKKYSMEADIPLMAFHVLAC